MALEGGATRVCLVLEGTAAAGGSWAAARQAVVDPLLRRLEAGGGGFELAVVVCRSGRPFSATPVERAGWTADTTRVRQGLDAVRFQGGGDLGQVRLSDALEEACYLFQQPSALGPPEALQQHCLLACHSAACSQPPPWAPAGQLPQGPGTVGPEELVQQLAGAGVSLSLLLQSSPRPPAQVALAQLFAAAARAQGQRQPQQQLLAACQTAASAAVTALVSPAWPALAAAVAADARARRLLPDPAAAAPSGGGAESPALLAPSPGQAAAAADSPSPDGILQLPTPPSAWSAPSPPQASAHPAPAAAAAGQQAGLPQDRSGPGHSGQMLPPPQHSGLAHAAQQWQHPQPPPPPPQQQQQQNAFRTVWSGEVVLAPAAARTPTPVQLLAGSAVVGAAFAADASAWPRSLVVERLVDYRSPAISELSRRRGAAVQGRFLARAQQLPPATAAALQRMVDACLGGLVPLPGCALVFVASPEKPGGRGQFRLGFVITPPWT